MASIRERPIKGGESTWAVLYRHGAKQASKAFESAEAADDFRELVDRFGPDRALQMHAQGEEPAGVTVRAIAEKWLAWKKRDLTPRAAADYERDYLNWIDPFFGHRSAEYVNEVDVQEWVDNDLSRKLGPKSVADKHAILHGIFKYASARTRGLVTHNPCKETELPKRQKTQPKGLTVPEWLALKDAAYEVDEDAGDLTLFLASTGWRIGEATALMARNVYDDGSKVWVTVSHVQRKGSGVVAGAKSDAAFRRIDLNAEAGRMLRKRLIGIGPNDYVFTNSASPTGLWEPSTYRRRYWAKALKLAGLEERKPTPHHLRHTHVMLCHAAGMTLPEIQRRLGHEHIQTTIDVYGRMLGQASDEVMGRLDYLISGSAPATVAGEVVQGALTEN